MGQLPCTMSGGENIISPVNCYKNGKVPPADAGPAYFLAELWVVVFLCVCLIVYSWVYCMYILLQASDALVCERQCQSSMRILMGWVLVQMQTYDLNTWVAE